jgi:RNA polymerase sigma factor (sigma-70 family)
VSHDDPLTSLHVRRALHGDVSSLAWVVERFSPLLLAQARYRLGTRLRLLYDPHDLVNDVWLRALPRLSGIDARDRRVTPVILRFLAITLLNRVSDLFDKHFRGKPLTLEAAASEGSDAEALHLPAAESTDVVSRAVRSENGEALRRVLDEMEPRDREVLVLRGIEQRENQEVAAQLGIDGDAASTRYRRALQRLRDRLPAVLSSDLCEP